MGGMHIVFALMGPLQAGAHGPTSDLASARYRVIAPARQLCLLGHSVRIVAPTETGWTAEVMEAPCDVLVVSKTFKPEAETLAKEMKARGKRVVVDICDDHFGDPEHAPVIGRLISMADQVVASTPAMAESIQRHAGRASVVVTDPVEGPRGVPKFSPRLQALRLAWFGNHKSLAGIHAKADQLVQLARQFPVHFLVLTDPNPEAAQFVASLATACAGRARIDLLPWSVESTWQLLDQCDVVWIPSEGTQATTVKSPNRLLEALWAGRFVAADPVPSYMPFADLLPIGRSLTDAVIGALRDPEGAVARIHEAQRRIARDYSPFSCGRQWAAALGAPSDSEMRLNLGCGDKILPGYVNVDVVSSRAGKNPDVICDLHDLYPFPDDFADEILSVHVVEHFWRWEVRDVLREWIRVLKPGGRMIIECPNLLSACASFVEDPAARSREGQEGQRTMWVFYGDPAWKDPLMVHRWGYVPESLKALLAEAGLVDVRQEPAQFKLREPRDMRVVGIKPHG